MKDKIKEIFEDSIRVKQKVIANLILNIEETTNIAASETLME